MNVRFFLKSDEKVEDIEYYLEVSNWTSTSFDIKLNFTKPMQIS